MCREPKTDKKEVAKRSNRQGGGQGRGRGGVQAGMSMDKQSAGVLQQDTGESTTLLWRMIYKRGRGTETLGGAVSTRGSNVHLHLTVFLKICDCPFL